MNGLELNETSPVKALKDACEYFGINQSGSKKKLFERLCNDLEQQHKRDAVVLSENLKKRMQEPSLSVQKQADPLPDEAEQERHAVTHLPYMVRCRSCYGRTHVLASRFLQNPSP